MARSTQNASLTGNILCTDVHPVHIPWEIVRIHRKKVKKVLAILKNQKQFASKETFSSLFAFASALFLIFLLVSIEFRLLSSLRRRGPSLVIEGRYTILLRVMYVAVLPQVLLTRRTTVVCRGLFPIVGGVYRSHVPDGCVDVVPVRDPVVVAATAVDDVGRCVTASSTSVVRARARPLGRRDRTVAVLAGSVGEFEGPVDVQTGLPGLKFGHHPPQTGHAGRHDAREDHDLVEEGGDGDLEGLVAILGFDGVKVRV